MNRFRLALLIIIIMSLTACAEQSTKSAELIPVEERNIPFAKAKPQATVLEQQTNIENQKKVVSKQKESVITALLDDADLFSNKGQSEKAAATIERALRIEPKNALLWHRLAVIRMQQQQWQQAIAMARKSNALAANNKKLKSDNWAVIAAAYDNLGNKKKANEARNKQFGQA
ncbi:MAG TPA: tetratricopeptide repeat protein [Thiotrichaceae bacterium]|jgi:tetratricopeptide (TPR) repeat protein|nr:tetratricopeptide repeat protein [Thiotrichaceae bacterium]HIM08737.1 tetratricopeptide repeat protein [Gammaproteobacteria bacterium]